MRFAGATNPGSPTAENEDWAAATTDLVVVLDGATIRTETGCRHGAAWFTRKLGSALLSDGSDRDTSLEDALANAIGHVADLHTECDLTHPGTPSAGVGIVRLHEDHLRWLVLGDVTIVAETPDGVFTISDQRISASAAAERAEVNQHLIGTPEKNTALAAMKHAELAARNREYWIAATDPSVVTHAMTGAVPLDTVRRLAVMTDGAARWVDMFRSGEWATVLKLLDSRGPEWFIEKLVRSVEAADPLGARFPRNKTHDDATAVFVETGYARPDPPVVSQEALERAMTELADRVNDPGLFGDGIMIKGR